MKIFRFRRKSGAEERAFTLVEMMTTVSLLSMLILAGMSLMTSGSIFFRNSTKNAFAESDVTYAARFVEMKLADASQFTISAAGTRIDFKNSDGIDCAFVLTAVDDTGFSGHRTLQYTRPDAANKTVLVGIPTATAVFSPISTGVDRQSTMDAYRRITVTLLAEQQSAASTGAVKLVRQKTVLRIVPRNLYDDISGNI